MTNLERLEEKYLFDLDLAELTDSSIEDDGDLIRTGNIPQSKWYRNELHDGYDIDAKKVTVRGIGDNIDAFLLNKNKNELKRRIYDLKNDQIRRLNDRDLSIINRLRKGQCAAKMYQQNAPDTHVFDITTMGIRPKSSFVISKSDHKNILETVNAIKNGWIKVNKYGEIKEHFESKRQEMMRMDPYRSRSTANGDIWDKNVLIQSRQMILAPKCRQATTYESYNPPSEYLFSEKQKAQQSMHSIIPTKYECLRLIPQFDRFIHERFERCLDLYLLPRKIRKKRMINPKHLLPKLPSVDDLAPFPEILSAEYCGHAQSVRCIDVSFCGEWVASGSDDGTIRIFEVDSGREFYRHSFGANNRIESVAFNPSQNKQSLLSVVCGHRCFLIPIPFISSHCDHHKHVISVIDNVTQNQKQNKMMIPRLNLQQTLHLFSQHLLQELSHWPSLIESMENELKWTINEKLKQIAHHIQTQTDTQTQTEAQSDDMGAIKSNSNDVSIAARWSLLTFHQNKANTIIAKYQLMNNHVVCISFLNYLSGMRWHNRGDYFATFRSEKERSSLMIHRFSTFESQMPFSSSIGCIQDVVFHPRKPLIYVACKQSIRCFNLEKCKLQEKYSITTSWISRIDLHDSGLNLIVGGMDGKVSWYDMDLSHSPYKTFNYHCSGNGSHTVRNVVFHHNTKYNHLWASCGDDGKIFIFYCKMFRDKFVDPILIPLKILQIKKHRFLDIKWHKTQPWIFAACSDGITRLYTAL